MAFNISGQKSLKLNHIPAGQSVTLCDFQTKKPFATGKLVHWLDAAGSVIPAPSVMANADQKTTIVFDVFHDVVTVDETGAETVTRNEGRLVLVKDPNGAGCFFRNVEQDETKPAKLRRVTVYAAEGLVSEIRAAKKVVAEQTAPAVTEPAPAKAEEAQAEPVEPETEQEPVAEVVEAAPNNKRSRNRK